MTAGLTLPITAMVTAYRRVDAVLKTLHTLRACDPAPSEILVHVDGSADETAAAIRRAFPDLAVTVSRENIGPGGARNAMVAAAHHEIVASFDDDSYPIDRDYFARLATLFERHPDAWVVGAHVFHRHEAITLDSESAAWVADFVGCGCAYRRSRYLETGGYVPLPTAYGMEEVDFGLRAHALGGRVLRAARLRVFHDTDLSHHADPAVTSASIVNLALLAFLRYPPSLWAVGAAQCANRIQWLVRHGRRHGVLSGLAAIPATLARHRERRQPLPARSVRSFLALRRRAQPV